VIAHTDCRMLTFTNDDIRGKLADEAGGDTTDYRFPPPSPISTESVRASVDRVRSSNLLPESFGVSGYVYDCSTGSLRAVA
jgi:carbonic anhydrase